MSGMQWKCVYVCSVCVNVGVFVLLCAWMLVCVCGCENVCVLVLCNNYCVHWHINYEHAIITIITIT